MWKNIAIVCTLLIISILIVVFLMWNFAGFRQHFSITRYLQSITNSAELDSKKTIYYGDSTKNFYGGILALQTKNRLFLWHKSRLIGFKITNKTKFAAMKNCIEEIYQNEQDRSELLGGSPNIRVSFFYNVTEWMNQIKPGMHLYVHVDPNNRQLESTSLIANPDLSISNFVTCMYSGR